MISAEGVILQNPTVGSVQAPSIQVGDHTLINEQLCEVTHASSFRAGKGNLRKTRLVGIDIKTGELREKLIVSTTLLKVYPAKLKEFRLLEISDEGHMVLLEENGEITELVFPQNQPLILDQLLQEFHSKTELIVTTKTVQAVQRFHSFRNAN